MKNDPSTRQHRSEMGRLLYDFAAGMTVKVVAAGVILYVGCHAYSWLTHVFDPITKAMAG